MRFCLGTLSQIVRSINVLLTALILNEIAFDRISKTAVKTNLNKPRAKSREGKLTGDAHMREVRDAAGYV